MSEPSFNLINRPWIPCLGLDGRPTPPLSLADVLTNAHQLRQIECQSPLNTAAVTRLLLAVLHAAMRGPATIADRVALWRAGRFDAQQLRSYLDRWYDRFDLFSEERPFYQTPGFCLEPPSTIALLAPELASGNNPVLFDHTVDGDPPAIDPATAAIWLVTYQTFALGGGQGPTSKLFGKHPNARSAPASQGALVLLEGDSLFQTLLLNLVTYTETLPFPGTPEDRPVWEWGIDQLLLRDGAPGRDLFVRPLPGYLAYLTWPIRCVRLRPERTPDGWRVRHVDVAQGPYFAPNPIIRDPFFAFRVPQKGEPRPLKITAERALWRDSQALFSAARIDEKTGRRARPTVLSEAARLASKLNRHPLWRLRVVGVDSDQAKINLWREERLPLPSAVLADDDEAQDRVDALLNAVAKAEQVGQAVNAGAWALAQLLLKPDDPGSARREDVNALVDAWGAAGRYWPALAKPFAEYLAGLDEDMDAAYLQWLRAAVAAADRAMELALLQVGDGSREMRARVGALITYRSRIREVRREADSGTPTEEEDVNEG